MNARNSAVMLMAYGTPERLDQVEAYFTHIRGGRQPSPEAVRNLQERYERVGGGTPLLNITRQLANSLAATLAAEGTPRRVDVGMKHWRPYIADVAARMAEEGVRQVTAVALAPHYSKMSVGSYRTTLEETNRKLGEPFALRVVERWHDRPEFLEMMASLVRDGLEQFSTDPSQAYERDPVVVVFSAHSLPVRVREWNDPYEDELMTSSAAVAAMAGLNNWRFAWQSAGGTTEPWLGPDILDYLETLHAEGVRNVLQVPIGFVSDHLEVLYDIDIEAKEKARELGMTLHRTQLPNASDALVRTLAAVVRDAESAGVAGTPRLE
jgi:protoporphyrin/coproporphyrin ferrochelatase